MVSGSGIYCAPPKGRESSHDVPRLLLDKLRDVDSACEVSGVVSSIAGVVSCERRLAGDWEILVRDDDAETRGMIDS